MKVKRRLHSVRRLFCCRRNPARIPLRNYYKRTPEGKENVGVQIEEWKRFIDVGNERLRRFA